MRSGWQKLFFVTATVLILSVFPLKISFERQGVQEISLERERFHLVSIGEYHISLRFVDFAFADGPERQELGNGSSGSSEGPKDGVFSCDWYQISCHVMNLFYLIIVVGGNFLVGISGYLLDIFLKHSIESTSYTSSDFLLRGWELLRDLTNFVFIFAILYEAFRLVLGVGGAVVKKVITIIVMALAINFSLYASFFVIDTSNILAHTLYNKISVSKESSYTEGVNTGVQDPNLEVKERSLSIAIAKNMNPQRIFGDLKWEEGTRAQIIILIIVAAFINGALFFTFFKISFLFLGRTIGLWIYAMVSPLAFASKTVPGMEKSKYIGFDGWLKQLLGTAFMAPVFIFLLYLIVQFINIFPKGMVSGVDFLNDLLGRTIIPTAVIVTVIILSEKISKSLAGDFAKVAVEYANKVGKWALGVTGAVALGGAAFLGRQTVGKMAYKAMRNENHWMHKLAKSDSTLHKWLGTKWAAKKFMQNAEGISKYHFDPSKTWMAKGLGVAAGAFGVTLPKQQAWAKIGGSGEGGYEKWREEKIKRQAQKNKYLSVGVQNAEKSLKESEDELKSNEELLMAGESSRRVKRKYASYQAEKRELGKKFKKVQELQEKLAFADKKEKQAIQAQLTQAENEYTAQVTAFENARDDLMRSIRGKNNIKQSFRTTFDKVKTARGKLLKEEAKLAQEFAKQASGGVLRYLEGVVRGVEAGAAVGFALGGTSALFSGGLSVGTGTVGGAAIGGAYNMVTQLPELLSPSREIQEKAFKKVKSSASEKK